MESVHSSTTFKFDHSNLLLDIFSQTIEHTLHSFLHYNRIVLTCQIRLFPRMSSKTTQPEDDFETVSHEDAQAAAPTSSEGKQSANEGLQLTRFDNDVHEEEDSDEEENAMSHHPLFGMLAGRLGQRRRGSTHKYDKLHPENQVLTPAYIKDCVEVENSAFPENERASQEKVRLAMNWWGNLADMDSLNID